jgi:hypothetical protein
MATGKSAAVQALDRAEDEMRKHQSRVAEARKAAARELGDAVLASGAGRLPTIQLKAILGAVVAMGAEQALTALGVKAVRSVDAKASTSAERTAASRGRGNGADDNGRAAGADA